MFVQFLVIYHYNNPNIILNTIHQNKNMSGKSIVITAENDRFQKKHHWSSKCITTNVKYSY